VSQKLSARSLHQYGNYHRAYRIASSGVRPFSEKFKPSSFLPLWWPLLCLPCRAPWPLITAHHFQVLRGEESKARLRRAWEYPSPAFHRDRSPPGSKDICCKTQQFPVLGKLKQMRVFSPTNF
jgi:hypothetical protein